VGARRGYHAIGLLLPFTEVLGLGGDPDEGRIYWCRFENSHGQTWETLNPADPTAALKIKRVRGQRLRERRQARRLRALRKKGLQTDATIMAELRAGAGSEAPSATDDPA
jgi:hypothetical protein